MPRFAPAVSALLALGTAHGTLAQETLDPATPQACTGLETDAERLACYDKAFGRDIAVGVQAEIAQNAAAARDAQAEQDKNLLQRVNPFARTAVSEQPLSPTISLLDGRWELSEESKLGTFSPRAYKPMYLLPIFASSNPNTQPSSPNPVNNVETRENLKHVEAKFQLSLKTKAVEGVFGDAGDLWLGYTQSSRWQVYNDGTSRPFRETNYEPEANLVFRTNYSLFGWNGRLLGIGLNHQSNGRDLPQSRSWNRVIANIGLERGDWVVMLRPWSRIQEDKEKDDNADISDYVGRGDATIVHKWKDHEFSLMLRHTLKGGDESRGAAQFDWAFPLGKTLRGHLQVFDGYGESLIDYNHRATYVGLGVSLLEWY